ncbi:MAG: outer membrane integrity protein [Cytophagales bacterium]|nr:MAG: outer membrane integrity protein [Cytophagales bacterium]
MKKKLIIIGSIIAFFLLSLALIPIIFKDKIKAAIDKELSNTLNAQIIFDFDKFSLSIFRNFPNITISIEDFGLIAKQAEFNGDTLFASKKMSFVADIMSVISGEKISVKSIYLNQPYIATLTAKNGVNSWATLMISNPNDTLKNEDTTQSKFAVNIEKWELQDATIIYDDATMPIYAKINHLNHTGSGNLTQEIADVKTSTSTPDFFLSFDNVTYFNKHSFNAKFNVNTNYTKGDYKFLENEIAINDFKMNFDGTVSMPKDEIIMDIKFKALETEFKHLISLIPSVFMKDYDKIKTDGKLAFDGYVKGKSSENSTPGFGLNLKINDGMLQYPDLPTAIKNIKTDISVDNANGITQNMIINIKQFHMDMGSNPIDARALIEGIEPYKIDADVSARVNLEEITKIYPLEGVSLKGLFNLKVKANGTYSDTLKLMPVVDAKMNLEKGYVKSKDIPAPLEDVHFDISATSASSTSSTKIWINDFNMIFEKQPFAIKAYLENLDNIAYDVKLKGLIDLTKLTKLYPIEGTTLSGSINADIATKGVMSDIEAGKYDRTSTSGTMEINNLKYLSQDLPQGLSLSKANYTLSPEKMNIQQMDGFLGKSDISIKGYFANYMGYLFGHKDTTLRASISFSSKQFDVNEWMTPEDPNAKTTEQTTTGVFEVPKDIDFALNTSINKVLYTNMVLDQLSGNIFMKQGIAKMEKLKFNILGGAFLFTGLYNSQNIQLPTFDVSEMKIDNMLISDAYKTFNTVKSIAPIAENMKGAISLAMNMKGNISNEMMPVYNTLNGAGNAKIASAELSGNKMMNGLGKMTGKNLDPLAMKDVAIKFQIIDGKVVTQPFDINAGGIKMNLGGSNALDGKIDYNVKMDLPAGAVGAAANNAVANLLGKPASNNQNIKLDFKVLGDYNSPKIALIGSNAGQAAKESVKAAVVDKAKETIQNNEQVQKAQAEADRIKKEGEAKAQAEADRIKKEADDKIKNEAEKLKKEAKKKFGF